jgi:hypothetical protein
MERMKTVIKEIRQLPLPKLHVVPLCPSAVAPRHIGCRPLLDVAPAPATFTIAVVDTKPPPLPRCHAG